MRTNLKDRTARSLHIGFFVLLLSVVALGNAEAFTLKVRDDAGNKVKKFRWMVEEDTTNVATPGTFSPNTLGVNIHTTYAPVIKKGHSDSGQAVIDVPVNKRWLVSVLPDAETDGSLRFTAGGHLVEKGADSVTVVVNTVQSGGVLTAQISIFIFNDNAPINNAPDIGEPGLGDFSIFLFDQAGQVSQDAFGNQLGTDYQRNPDGTFQFNADGSPVIKTPGSGEIITCVQAEVDAFLAWEATVPLDYSTRPRECRAVGEATIKFIPPGKYGVRAVPTPGQTWTQTSTIEGTPGIDAWVKANEPNRLVEFGPALYHVFIGFIQPFDNFQALRDLCATAPPVCVIAGDPPVETCTPVNCTASTVTGNIRRTHSTKAQFGITAGPVVEECWIGINALELGTTAATYFAPCAADSTFTIPNVPPGTYQIVAGDRPLDHIFYFASFIVDGSGTTVDLTDTIFMNQWFGNIENTVFYDTNQNGFRECVTPACDNAALGDEVGIEGQNINLRWRDGTIYQFSPTDIFGESPLNEVFPLFRNYIIEVDFLRFKATGATIVVDDGGVIPPANGWTMPSFDKLNPQAQFCTMSDIANGTIADYGADKTAGTADDVLCTTVGTPIIHPFTNNNLARLEQGVVLLEATTVYADQTNKIDWGKADYAPGENGGLSGVMVYATTRAEDDPSLAATDPWEPGIPRVQVNLYADWNNDGVIDDADGNGQIQLADVDNHPFGNFPGPEDIDRNGNGAFNRGDALNVATSDSWDDNLPTGCQGEQQFVLGQPIVECAETLKTWNTVRPGLFDGGWAFDAYYPFGKGLFGNPDAEIPLPGDMMYIVEAVPPPGFQIIKEESRNVDFGDPYVPSPQLVPWPCVGTVANKQPKHVVPPFLDLFPEAQIPASRAGETTPLCNMKQIFLADTQNGAADFHLYTEVPKASRGVGLINNDVAITLDPNNPIVGEKAGAVWMPISVQDLNGHEMTRVYTDQFGTYNFIAPSTFTVNAPIPTGVSPNMLRICLNHPGPIPDPARPSRTITDPFFDRRFSLTCYTLDFWPGKTTYLDTPVIPVAAYTAVFDATLDCEFPDGTPVIFDVTGPNNVGPYVSAPGQTLTIKSVGDFQVANPDCSRFDPTCAPQITRDYGFGDDKGTVRINGVDVPNANVVWANNRITVTVPNSAATGQLEIIRGDNGVSTVTGITVTIGGPAPTVVNGGSIQAAIDAAAAGDLIIVRPGRYDENIIMNKNVKLQGSGAFSTTINSAPTLPENLQNFRQRVRDLLNVNAVSLIPGETLDQHIELAAVTVIANDGVFTADPHGRIDGFTITSATSGGGITVNGYGHFLEISNNRVLNNAGSWGGGIRVGTPGLTDTNVANAACGPASAFYCSSANDNITIHDNHILENGSVGATTGGGGIALFNGADNYRVTGNYICGNFTTNRGGGIAHAGLSPNGLIENNSVLLNESSFNSLTGGEGGGIIIQGEPARVPAIPVPLELYLTPGTGSVKVNANLIQANMAGNGKGGGIYVFSPNGEDVDAAPGTPASWYGIDIFNNIIANNVAGWMGGGIFLQDAAKVRIDHNTIVNNSSTSTGANALLGVGLNQPTIPQAAGVVSGTHSLGLANALAVPDPNVPGITYSNPELINNIIRNNSSYSYNPTLNNGFGGLVPHPAAYWDLQVFGAIDPGQVLDPNDTILTSLTGPDGVDYNDGTNLAVDPLFIDDFTYTLRTAAAPGEGGNTVQVSILPIKPEGDYHLRTGSPAIDQAAVTVIPELAADYDGEVRPDAVSGLGDIGADEFSVQPVTAPSNIRLVTPNGNEVIPTGQSYAILWQAAETFPPTVTYRLQVSYNNGSTWSTIPGAEALATTTFNWVVPAKNKNQKKSLIRVQAFDGATKLGQDVSDNVFEVEVVKIVYPSEATVVFNEGVTIAPPYGINWRLNDVKKTVKKAKIEVSRDNGATWQKAVIAEGNPIRTPVLTENTTYELTWTVPNVNKTKAKAKIRITLYDNAGSVITQDQNDVNFTIAPAP